MTTLLFKLRNVPEDEAEEVRKLLQENDIDYYETASGRWGLGMPAIWVHEEGHYRRARSVLDRYQQERRDSRIERYKQQKMEGRAKTIFDGLKENPIRFVLYLAIIVAVAYLSIKPFLDFGQ